MSCSHLLLRTQELLVSISSVLNLMMICSNSFIVQGWLFSESNDMHCELDKPITTAIISNGFPIHCAVVQEEFKASCARAEENGPATSRATATVEVEGEGPSSPRAAAPGHAAQEGLHASRAAALVPAAQEGPSSSRAAAPGQAAQQPSNTQPQVSLCLCFPFLHPSLNNCASSECIAFWFLLQLISCQHAKPKTHRSIKRNMVTV